MLRRNPDAVALFLISLFAVALTRPATPQEAYRVNVIAPYQLDRRESAPRQSAPRALRPGTILRELLHRR